MENKVQPTIEQHFGDLIDPRIDRTKLHRPINILVIAICAVVVGADNWDDVKELRKDRIEWIKMLLELPSGILLHDTFTRVLAFLYSEHFQACFFVG